MTSVPFVEGLEDQWVIPLDNAGGKYPGIGIVNSSAYSSTSFVLTIFDTAGNLRKTFTKTVAPRNLSWFALVDENPDLASIEGQIKISGGFYDSAVFTFQFAPNGAFTAIPVVQTFGMR